MAAALQDPGATVPRPPEDAGGPPIAAGPGPDARGLSLQALGFQMRTLDLELVRMQTKKGGGSAAANSGTPPDPANNASELAGAEKEAAPLIEKWRKAAPGKERAAAMDELTGPMFRLLAAGGSPENLVLLEESAERGETTEERSRAVIAAHRVERAEVVDYLLARTRSPNEDVRFYAVEGLAWVRGAERARALEGVAIGLQDSLPRIRAVAAMSLGSIAGDPRMADALLARIPVEPDPKVLASMERAVRDRDPKNGAERVKAAEGR